MSLLSELAAFLERRGCAHALIGAAAMAIHGVARSTHDVDLLVKDRDLLLERSWEGFPRHVAREARPGDAADPLAGVVRLEQEGESVDLVIGRGAWLDPVLQAAQPGTYAEVTLPVVGLVGLVQLKLYAGGPQDMWDVLQLLAGADGTKLEAVSAAVATMPRAAQARWARVQQDLS